MTLIINVYNNNTNNAVANIIICLVVSYKYCWICSPKMIIIQLCKCSL